MDLGPAVHQQAGLARYAERLAVSLAAGGQVDLSLFHNVHSGHRVPASLAALAVHTVKAGQLAWRLSVLASQLSALPYRPVVRPMKAQRLQLYHATEHLLPRVSAPAVLTVHDLIFERYPEHHTRRNSWFLRLAMPRFCRAATAIIAVSRHTAGDLQELYQIPAAKIHVIHEGIEPRFQPAPLGEVEHVRAVYSPDRPYLLMVGTLEPRKNHVTALRALARLKAQGWPGGRRCRLLIVGGAGWLFSSVRAEVARLGLDDDVHFAGYVPDVDMPPLYSGAAALLLPSLYEGFGFPVLEAMACGAPVICSQVSSLPEVAGAAALFHAPLDDEELAAQIQQVLESPEVAAGLRQQGLAWAPRFRWETTAAATAALYRSLVHGPIT
jgi:glycosyltransferase involved in cell wall biosynthesis